MVVPLTETQGSSKNLWMELDLLIPEGLVCVIGGGLRWLGSCLRQWLTEIAGDAAAVMVVVCSVQCDPANINSKRLWEKCLR